MRVIGVDDGPFTRRHKYAPLVAVAMSLPSAVEGVRITRVRVDGSDATDRLVELLEGTPVLAGARAILFDGVSVGGFNLLDLDRIHRELGPPVVSVTRRPPDFPSIRSALAKYFPEEFDARWRLVRRHRPFPSPTAGEPLWVAAVGATPEEARALVRRATVVGYWPEPLRLAHMVARAVVMTRPPSRAARRRKPGPGRSGRRAVR
jgi:hypothetical protein